MEVKNGERETVPAERFPLKNILLAPAVAGIGFILLNLTLLLNGLVFHWLDLLRPPPQPESWFVLRHIIFMVIILVISWAVFRTRLRVWFKAGFLMVPAAVTLLTIGMFLGRWPVLAYGMGGLLSLVILLYFYRTRKSWLYFYSVILVAVALLIFGLAGVDI